METRRIRAIGLAGTAALFVSGCTTFSFATPKVEVDKVITDQRPSACGTFASDGSPMIDKNVDGAMELTNNFLRAYRCSAHEAADGRQVFQVPSFFATIVAAVGPTFGLGDDGRIGAAAGAAVLDRGNSYYAPKDKAQVLDSALDAILCVKTEAVGISFFDTTQAKPGGGAANAAAVVVQNAAESTEKASKSLDAQANNLRLKRGDLDKQISAPELLGSAEGGNKRGVLVKEKSDLDAELTDVVLRKRQLDQQASYLRAESARLALLAAADTQPSFKVTKTVSSGTIEINVQRQYYEMVAASLFSIERVLAQRFSNIGSYDAAGIAAELKQLTAEQAEADKKADDAADTPVAGTPMAVAGAKAFASEAKKNEQLAELSLERLQPRLQQCVVRAKI